MTHICILLDQFVKTGGILCVTAGILLAFTHSGLSRQAHNGELACFSVPLSYRAYIPRTDFVWWGLALCCTLWALHPLLLAFICSSPLWVTGKKQLLDPRAQSQTGKCVCACACVCVLCSGRNRQLLWAWGLWAKWGRFKMCPFLWLCTSKIPFELIPSTMTTSLLSENVLPNV